jgi:hypothetical protein
MATWKIIKDIRRKYEDVPQRDMLWGWEMNAIQDHVHFISVVINHLTTIHKLPRKCGILNISHLCRPP